MTLDFEPETESLLLALAHAEGVTATEYVARWLREKASTQHFGTSANTTREKRPSAFGKYAFVPGGSEAFAREKQAEIEREDRPRT